jgi:hypothetical protein
MGNDAKKSKGPLTASTADSKPKSVMAAKAAEAALKRKEEAKLK